MFFKLTRSNPYRDFVRNARRIAISNDSAQAKIAAYRELYTLLKPRLFENERLLCNSPAFHQRCEHWNQRDISSIRLITNTANPWLALKREFENGLAVSATEGCALAADCISRSLAWFYASSHRDDWIVD